MKISSLSARTRALLLVLGLGAAGTLTWSATALNAGSPTVSVNVDPKPIAPVTSGLGASYAPVVKKVAPSVVKVQVSEKAKAVAAPELPPIFNHPG
ncbi:MAG TPA: hypothetical protein VL069_05525, partial [Opitutus sp.]|nr:hypothetical protein [Opitutus sp.]